jgi:hypothetical protein
MNECGKSDSSVVPAKPPNKTVRAVAEVVEERGLAKVLPDVRHEHVGVIAGEHGLAR